MDITTPDGPYRIDADWLGPPDDDQADQLFAQADRLQRLISSYMAQGHAEMDEAPQLRRAATAYTRGAGAI